MRDAFNREITYARFSVTDLCNLRCIYCMGEKGVEKKSHDEIMRYEQMLLIAECLASLGITKIRITGGEPLVRKGLCSFVEKLSEIEGISELGLTTNGVLLNKYAVDLKNAGINSLNVSIDSLLEERFKKITKLGSLSEVLLGIDTAINVGFSVKTNSVLLKGINDDEVRNFADFAKERGIKSRFIEIMPFETTEGNKNSFISSAEIIEREGLTKVGSYGSSDAVYYSYPDGAQIGFISALSDKFCDRCSRIRVTADGKLLPCLHGNAEYDLKPYLSDKNKLSEKLAEAIFSKPKSHYLDCGIYQKRDMSRIGG